MNNRFFWLAGIVLLALSVLLSGWAGWQGRRFRLPALPVPESSPTTPSNAVMARQNTMPFELAAGNLFDPLRGREAPQPPPEEPPKTPQGNARSGNFTLTGIYSYGQRRGAVIRQGSQRLPVNRNYFQVGDEIADGYILQQITDQGAVLIRGTETLNLPLRPPLKQEKKP